MNYKISQLKPEDYDSIITKINDWWGGRNVADMLSRLFFNHFSQTSFVAKDQGSNIIGFILGFISPDNPTLGYVHFIGVHPTFRKLQIGQNLYKTFFEKVKKSNVKQVECITSIVNTASINFHKRLGFQIKKGNREKDGISYFEDYDGKDKHRVVFEYKL